MAVARLQTPPGRSDALQPSSPSEAHAQHAAPPPGRSPPPPLVIPCGSGASDQRWAMRTPVSGRIHPPPAERPTAEDGSSDAARVGALLDSLCALLLLAGGCAPAAAAPSEGVAACAAFLCYDAQGGMRAPGSGGGAAAAAAGAAGACCVASFLVCAVRAGAPFALSGRGSRGGDSGRGAGALLRCRATAAAAAALAAAGAVAAAVAAACSGAAPLPGVLLLWAPLGALAVAVRTSARAPSAAVAYETHTKWSTPTDGEGSDVHGSPRERRCLRPSGASCAPTIRVSTLGMDCITDEDPPTSNPHTPSHSGLEFGVSDTMPVSDQVVAVPRALTARAAALSTDGGNAGPGVGLPRRQSTGGSSVEAALAALQLGGRRGLLPPPGISARSVTSQSSFNISFATGGPTSARTPITEDGRHSVAGSRRGSAGMAGVESTPHADACLSMTALSAAGSVGANSSTSRRGNAAGTAAGIASPAAASTPGSRVALPLLRLGLADSAALPPAPVRRASQGSNASPAREPTGASAAGSEAGQSAVSSGSQGSAGRRSRGSARLRSTLQAAKAVAKMQRAVRFCDDIARPSPRSASVSSSPRSPRSPRMGGSPRGRHIRAPDSPRRRRASAPQDDRRSSAVSSNYLQCDAVCDGGSGDSGTGSDEPDPLSRHGSVDTAPARGSGIRYKAGTGGRLGMMGRKHSAVSFASTMLPRNASLFTIRTTLSGEHEDDAGSVVAGAEQRSHVREFHRIVKSVSGDGIKVINGYEVVEELGRGSFSKVKLCRDQRTGELRALKIIKQSHCKSLGRIGGRGSQMVAGLTKIHQEISIMKKVRHRNLIALHEVFDDPSADKIILVLDYASRGPAGKVDDATGHLVAPADPVPAETLRLLLRDVITGLRYLHHRKVLHRDIKPENILIEESGRAKLSDFGACTVLRQAHSADPAQGQVQMTDGTPAYFSPEATTGSAFCGFAADTWALGVTAYVLSQRKLPFHSLDRRQLRELITTYDPFPAPVSPAVPDPLLDLIAQMLRKEPQRRIALRDALLHPFLRLGSPGLSPPNAPSEAPPWHVHDVSFSPQDNVGQWGSPAHAASPGGGGGQARLPSFDESPVCSPGIGVLGAQGRLSVEVQSPSLMGLMGRVLPLSLSGSQGSPVHPAEGSPAHPAEGRKATAES
eukprot:TRINITY_DN14827_c0_g1_i3.p1 TRINITY_DN14827_c0_g1~~TRINITY_DN14827_c0_g1_i3.p1  ORF type:complete len:1182 (+),score=276.07 TRINITY_DN14827_c0_g1_i3:59-3547(+)